MIRDIELRVDISNSCNLRCIMCHQPYLDKEVRMMSLETFKRITDGIIKRVNVLFLSWTTEPLLNKELPDIIRFAKKNGVPCISLVTNLTLLTDNLVAAFVDNGIDRLNVSIDAVDPKLYAVIRQKDCLSEVLENVKKIQAFKRKSRSRFPHIALNMVLLKMNLPQLIPMIECARSLCINELNYSDISVPTRYDGASTDRRLQGLPASFNLHDQKVDFGDPVVQNLLQQAAQRAEEKGILLSFPGIFTIGHHGGYQKYVTRALYSLKKSSCFPLRSMVHLALSYVKIRRIKNSAYCSFPWRQMVITAEGEALPCCVWDDRNALGNIRLDRLIDIWNGETYRRLRRELSSGIAPKVCKACVRARSSVRQGI